MSSRLETLPVDVHLEILRFVEVGDVLALRNTSRALREITYHHSVWFDLLQTRVIKAGLPTPGLANRDVYSLSSSGLEAATLRAIRYRRNWTSSSPKPTTRIEFQAGTASPRAKPGLPSLFRLLASYFITVGRNLYLVTLTRRKVVLDTDRGHDAGLHQISTHRYRLQYWDFADSLRDPAALPRCVAEYDCQNLQSVCVNADPAHPASVALQSRAQDGTSYVYNVTILTVDPAGQTNPEEAVKEYTRFPGLSRGFSLRGSRLVMGDHRHSVHLMNVDTGEVKYVLQAPLIHDDPTIINDDFRCISVHTVGDFVLIFRDRWIHMYALTPRAAEGPDDAPPPRLEPIVAYRWRWPIDSMDVIEHQMPDEHRSEGSEVKPLCLLLRYGSIYPWPVNIIHQYIIAPNPAFDADAARAALLAGKDPASLADLPYFKSSIPTFQGDPYLAHSIPSPVRVFTAIDMTLGSHGTVLWLDAQTDPSSISQAGDRGQRIAGQVLRYNPERNENGVGPPAEEHVVVGRDRDDRHQGCLADGKDPTMMFHIQEERDDWVRIALHEQEGLVAMAAVDGTVTICSYV